MNKKFKILTIGLIVTIALVAVGIGSTFAQSSTPANADGFGRAGMRGSKMNGSLQGDNTRQQLDGAPIRDAVWQALADAFGLTTEELTAELESGKTLAEIAEANDIDRTELLALLQTVHEDALAQAVVDGTLTQEQADAILERISDNFELMTDRVGGGFNRMGTQGRMSGDSFNGRGAKGQLNNGDCPYGYEAGSGYQQPQP